MSYSVFNSKHGKRKYVDTQEGEAPVKKSLTTVELLIQELSRKQLSTDISMEEQLNHKKEFHSGDHYVGCINYSGESSLTIFQDHLNDVSNYVQLKRSNISDYEIQLYHDYTRCGTEMFKSKYKNINPCVLHNQIEDIIKKVESSRCKPTFEDDKPTQNISRHNEEYLHAVKPDSDETKLLKFALNNAASEVKEVLPHPLDELPELEKSLSERNELFLNCDTKRIRKKARNIKNKLDYLDKQSFTIPSPNKELGKIGQSSLWDCKTKPEKINVVESSNKTYLCQNKKLYTIKDGKIIKLSDSDINKTKIQCKLTIDEIKKNPKFVNYEMGIPNKILYVKNMANCLNEIAFKHLLEEMHVDNVVSVNIMKGKMRGQCFVEFSNIEHSRQCLDILNGVVIGNKPLIVQFSKR